MNKSCKEDELKEDLLIKAFEVWWPSLNDSLEKIKEEIKEEDGGTPVDNFLKNEMFEEILELSRTNQKLLRSPEVLFPPEYFESIIERINNREFSDRKRMLLEEQRLFLINLKNQTMQIRGMIEVYKNEGKRIDEEFYMQICRFFDTFQQYQIISEQNDRGLFRRK